jgi:hypothetical protein
MGRKRAFSWRKRLAALLVLALIGAGGWLWWQGSTGRRLAPRSRSRAC